MNVHIRLRGCDDNTEWDHEVSQQEYAFLLVLQAKSKEVSEYSCQPTLMVTKNE